MKHRFSVAVLSLMGAGLIAAAPAEAAASCAAGPNEGERITILVEGEGPDVVLIPGLSSPRAVWDTTAERLKGRYRLHRVQIRGFGDDAGANAEGPVLEPMMREVAGYIDECITDAGRPAPAIIGHSMGGLTGLMIAARAPGEVGRADDRRRRAVHRHAVRSCRDGRERHAAGRTDGGDDARTIWPAQTDGSRDRPRRGEHGGQHVEHPGGPHSDRPLDARRRPARVGASPF
ncbi:alpha/beta fold hydrolase [Sphingopyxis sp. PET50]|uniref:alpha/beta fold hydrolase n=1 Tax=Sphingopyxis sp. PET50 TaxID=2976533 RepID=UPI0021AF0150|nr:alpha/beta fold hydrolase [Sphingopyxis sp. PET50]